jgi:hypothetical protein
MSNRDKQPVVMNKEAYAGYEDPKTQKPVSVYRCPCCGRSTREPDRGAYGRMCYHTDEQ